MVRCWPGVTTTAGSSATAGPPTATSRSGSGCPGTLRSRPSAPGSISAWPAPPRVRCWPGETTTAGSLATAVSAEEETGLARTSGGGGLFGWGDNSLGQLGDGTTTSSDAPVSIPILVRGPSLGPLVSL